MKISLDGGALCPKENLHFGNYTFTKNLIEAIQKYDQENEYYIYSFCKKPAWIHPNNKLYYRILIPKMFWLSTRVSIEEIRQKKSIFLALNQAIPIITNGQVISFSHGLSFYFYPQFYPDSYYALKDQLESMIKRSSHLVVASQRVRSEMKKLFPFYNRFSVINYGVPCDMLDYQAGLKKKYFLFCGMNNRIKNVKFLINVFKEFRKNKRFQEYKFFLIGNLREFEDKKNNVFSQPNTTRESLRKLYAEATAYLTASYYESFNFPVLESLAQNCPVVGFNSAIIPEFREFVSLAQTDKDFIAEMTKIALSKRETKRDLVLKRFSWKKYISKLKKLYKSIQL